MPTLQQLVDSHARIAFFGGAGVSTESGIPDFRSADGLYRQRRAIPAEVLLSHDFFLEHPEEFYAFYRESILQPALLAKPNPAHQALARLERAGKLTGVVTQNIDGLHQAAAACLSCTAPCTGISACAAAGATTPPLWRRARACPAAPAAGWSGRTSCSTARRWTRTRSGAR